jgi:serine/threonine protein kinase
MDYLEGRSLSEEIKNYEQIDPVRSIHIFLQVCSALAHAHDQRIVHRDLKPSNVMLVQSDEDPYFVKVVDFGIAKILMEGSESLKLTATGDVFGSPYYMSPEQCMGQQLDARSDIYSMGCLMFETLTGRVPHEGKNVLETMYKHTNLATPALTNIKADPRLTLRLDQILQKCMAKVPEQRYQSMIELRDDLTELSGTPRKGFKLAAKLGINAADKGRKFDNRLAAISSKKLFWVGMPLLAVLALTAAAWGYYWYTTSGDPSPTDRELVLNKYVSRADSDSDVIAGIAAQCESNQAVLKNSIEKLSDAEQNHESNLGAYKMMLRTTSSYTPEELHQRFVRYGFYFTRNGDNAEALNSFTKALDLSFRNGFKNGLENAEIHSEMAQCLLAAGDGAETDARLNRQVQGNDAWTVALAAYNEFIANDVTSAPHVTLNLGNLLELSSRSTHRFKQGIQFLQALYNQRPREAAPLYEGVAYAQAAQFAEACMRAGIQTVQLQKINPQTQTYGWAQYSMQEIAKISLEKSLSAWQQLESRRTKRLAFYNEGVIYNRLGLLAEQKGDLTAAEQNFNFALDKLALANNVKDESVAKVLFNLSDIQLKQNHFDEYLKTHSDAKRIWADTFHIRKAPTS